MAKKYVATNELIGLLNRETNPAFRKEYEDIIRERLRRPGVTSTVQTLSGHAVQEVNLKELSNLNLKNDGEIQILLRLIIPDKSDA